VTFESLSGTQVLRDFVELPSQIFEHWLLEPEVLKRHARLIETGRAMPDDLIERLAQARHFQGFETVEYTAGALVDMALHAQAAVDGIDITAFERDELKRLGMPREIVMRHRLPHFLHLFASSAYAAGYYVYMWAEVLDADGFDAFREAGNPFDPAVAERLRRYVYAAGNTLEPGAAFRAFRGRDRKWRRCWRSAVWPTRPPEFRRLAASVAGDLWLRARAVYGGRAAGVSERQFAGLRSRAAFPWTSVSV
jgi:peptidyl-dipeptidase Dcp